MGASESAIMKNIQVAFTNLGARLFRNNVGLAWTGRAKEIKKISNVRVGPGDVVIRNARPIKFGLFKGSSDLIGWTRLDITEDYGFAGVARSVEDAAEVIHKF